jgi:sugar phosphate isomerase/epimerase
MRLRAHPQAHLTYCLNVHPGETWAEQLAAIRTHAVAVRARVGRPGPFGLGLRLSDASSRELVVPHVLQAFRDELAALGLYAFTVNAFPFGAFHGRPVKTQVYAQDWRTAARREYTLRVAGILAALLPPGVSGSISTLPGSYKPWVRAAADRDAMYANLAETALGLWDLEQERGVDIHLGLEPEPDCFAEHTPETIGIMDGIRRAVAVRLRAARGVSADAAEAAARRRIGVCVDTCHLAMQFEDLRQSVDALARAGIRISKVQLSAALACDGVAARGLNRFDEPVYLHQVRVLSPDGSVRRFADLPDALDGVGESGPGDDWRVHCHVPLYWEGGAGLGSTAAEISGAFCGDLARLGVEHLEIETYTFHVLPEALRGDGVVGSIAREYEWVLGRMHGGDLVGQRGDAI